MQRYELLEALGRGSMGSVHRAQDRLTGAHIALKRVEMAIFDDVEHREALAREFQTLAALHHPNIVRVLDYGFDRMQQPFFTMALLPKPQDFLAAAAPRGFFGKLDLMMQLLQAMAYLHRQGVLHRDLKPSNVLVTKDGQVHVVDFGLATTVDAQRTDAMGTVLYMAPEILRGQVSTPAADLFALAVIVYEALTGHHPFDSRTVNDTINRILLHTPDFDLVTSIVTDGLQAADYAENTPSPTLEPPQLRVVRPTAPYGDEPQGLSAIQRAERFVAVLQRLFSRNPSERQLDPYDVLDMFCEALDIAPIHESDAVRRGFLRAARFVGRKTELEQLTVSLRALSNGAMGGTWLVGGESGVGKSRLLEEVRVQALVRGVQVARSRATEADSSDFPLSKGFLPPLLLTLGIDSHEARDLKHLVPEIDRIVGYAVETPGDPFSMAAFRVQALILDVLKRMQRPTLLILEDLQWMGFEGGLIREITALAPALPLMVLGSYRTDEAPYLYGNLHRSEQIKLERFTRAELAALSRSMLGKPGAAEAVVTMLERESEGNITFAIEILQDLSQRSRRLDDLDEADLPHDIYTQGIMELAQRRVARLPLDYQPLMRLAAVAGRDVNFDILRHYDHVVKFPLWINAGMNAAILTNQDGKWQFAHDKLREGILAGLMPEERARLHRMVADALITLNTESPPPEPSLFSNAPVGYSPRTDAQQAAPKSATSQLDEDLQQQIIDHYLQAGEWDAAAKLLVQWARERKNRLADVSDVTRRVEDVLATVPDSAATARMQLLHTLGNLYYGSGQVQQRLALWQKALNIAIGLKNTPAQVELNLMIAHTHMRNSNFASAHNYCHSAYQLSLRSSDSYLLARSLGMMAEMLWLEGQYAEAVQHQQQAVTLYKKAGFPNIQHVALGNLAESYLALGNFAEALRLSEQVIDYMQQQGLLMWQAPTHLRAIQANIHLHNYAAAQEHIDTARLLLANDPGQGLNRYLDHYAALLALRTGDAPQAAALYTQLEQAIAEGIADSDRFHVLMYAPLAHALASDEDAAVRVLALLFRIYHQGAVQPGAEYRLYLLLGLAALAWCKGDFEQAQLACRAIMQSKATTGEIREHTDWLMTTCAISIDADATLPMDAESLLLALHTRYMR
jgi:tRNA A-37 threonylcarbamoyl transferase component Bud32/tetratricopeptide (TPR) repeat protein